MKYLSQIGRRLQIGLSSRSWTKPQFVAYLLLLSVVFANMIQAATIRVPADVATIQQGINAALNGDTVLVEPGTYYENISFPAKAVTLLSEQGPDVTIIDGQQAVGAVVTFAPGAVSTSVLSGFTITNGRGVYGGGVTIEDSSPTIVNNHITSNQACGGGGMFLLRSSAIIDSNDIYGNLQVTCDALEAGAGIWIRDAVGAQITSNRIFQNSASRGLWGGGLLITGASRVTIRDNIVAQNSSVFGGGLFLGEGSLDIFVVQNVIVANIGHGGGGITGWADGARIINNTIVNNDAFPGSGLYMIFAGGNSLIANNIVVAPENGQAIDCLTPINSSTFIFNNVFGNGGVAYGPGCGEELNVNGNISANPLFLDSAAGDFQLRFGSPSIDTGSNQVLGLPEDDFNGNPRIVDADGIGGAVIDMGAFEFRDAIPPTISVVSATPNVLLQANHQMVPVTINVSVSDNNDPNVVCRIISVTSNEPVDGLGDGDTSPDWIITGNLGLNLRAERSGKANGRVYTITIECSDSFGNSSTETVTVSVPRNN
jgi:Right handed beta helix region